MTAVASAQASSLDLPKIEEQDEKEVFNVRNLPINLDEPDVQVLINRINAFNDKPEQVQAYLFCLSRVTEPRLEGQYKQIYRSALIEGIDQLLEVSDTRQYVLNALRSPTFRSNDNVRELARKADYITKNRFFSDAAHGFVLSTKFSHHLSSIIKSVSSSIGVGIGMVLVGTLPFTLSGITQVASPDNSSGVKYGVGITSIVAGAGFVAAPFIEAYYKSGQNNP